MLRRVVAFVVVAVVACGCDGGDDDPANFYRVDGVDCLDADGVCVVDFGVVDVGLSQSVRVSWKDGSAFGLALLDEPGVDDDGVFVLESQNGGLGVDFDEGFAFVAARPVVAGAVRGAAELDSGSVSLVLHVEGR
jgi:hypothetical protein